MHSQPDGDSVHFFPDNPAAFTSLHINAHLGSGGAAQLRLDAIDALETHYTPPAHGAKTMHQPLDLAHAARGPAARPARCSPRDWSIPPSTASSTPICARS